MRALTQKQVTTGCSKKCFGWLGELVGVPLLQMKESGDRTQDFLFRYCANKTLAFLSHRQIKQLVATAPGVIQTRKIPGDLRCFRV